MNASLQCLMVCGALDLIVYHGVDFSEGTGNRRLNRRALLQANVRL